MNPLSSTQSFIRISLAAGLALGLATLSGCGIGNGAPATGFDTVVGHIQGTLHGGPNPINGATVKLYATGDTSGNSTGYGVGQSLQTATSDPNGNFTFAGGYTCPANQYAYIVATGGKTGSNNVNPNSVLMAALGPCTGVSASTFVIVNELTTVAAGYALSNFINVTGDAVNGYAIGIGAPATNNASTGCVNNAYYGTGTCPTTSAAGLAHAFANAAALANSGGGTINATTASGAIVPVQLINTLGNILQACVNSNGGGTDLTTGAPTTTTTTAGHTTNDGTPCGKLFSYTSYTNDGTATGTLNAPGNTLSAIQNLAKRPSGSATLFDTNCSSGGSGSTTAATCIFNLGAPVGIYQTSMTVAPSDWMLGISYPMGSFSTASTGVSCSGTPTTNGALYPFMVATDINDNVVILNGDQSTATCYNLLTISSSGTPLAGNDFDNNSAIPIWVATDAFGHAIIPVHGSGATAENGVRIYGATDPNLPLDAYITGVTNTPNNLPFYVAVGQNDSIFVDSQSSTTTNNFGYLTVSGTESHGTPAYTVVTPATVNTNKFNMINVDITGTGFTTQSSSTASKTVPLAAGGTTTTAVGVLNGSTSNGVTTAADTSGNIWNVENEQGSYSTGSATAVATPSPGIYVFKQTLTTSGTTVTPSTATLVTTLTPGAVKPQNGQIDGNNVIWFTDLQGATTKTPPAGTPITINSSALHGYDTVNNFDTHLYTGCKFANSASTACGSQTTDSTYPSSTPYLFYGSRGIAIDSAGSIWVANGTQGQINEIIGTAAPTWPLFIHNGTSNKP